MQSRVAEYSSSWRWCGANNWGFRDAANADVGMAGGALVPAGTTYWGFPSVLLAEGADLHKALETARDDPI